ncbi:MAG: hypothetical protein LAP38_14610 [Acidobacteriia bacterium]|nr:hypothetical protein [Terriglobia bacterium]
MRRRAQAQCTLALVFLLASAVHAQNAFEPPSAAGIFNRYVAATGGQAAYDRIQNQITAITLTRDGQAVGHSTYYQTRAGDFRLIDVAGDQTTETGLNAGVAWRKTPESAELLESEGERGRVLRDAVMLPESQWRRFYKDAVFETGAPVEGKSCYQVAATPFVGQFQRLWFDDESGLLVKQEVTEPEGSVEFLFEDYSDAGAGLRMARKQTIQVNGVTFVVTVDRVQFNQPIPASTFDLPPEIARLLKKKSAQ